MTVCHYLTTDSQLSLSHMTTFSLHSPTLRRRRRHVIARHVVASSLSLLRQLVCRSVHLSRVLSRRTWRSNEASQSSGSILWPDNSWHAAVYAAGLTSLVVNLLRQLNVRRSLLPVSLRVMVQLPPVNHTAASRRVKTRTSVVSRDQDAILDRLTLRYVQCLRPHSWDPLQFNRRR